MPLYSMCYIRTAQYFRLVLLYILTRSAPERRNMLPLPSPEKCNALPWDIRPHRRLRSECVAHETLDDLAAAAQCLVAGGASAADIRFHKDDVREA